MTKVSPQDLASITGILTMNEMFHYTVIKEQTIFHVQVEDVMIQCILCEDWYHSRVSQSSSHQRKKVLALKL